VFSQLSKIGNDNIESLITAVRREKDVNVTVTSIDSVETALNSFL